MFRWRNLKIPRFFGLDKKTNIVDVRDGFCLDCENVYQNSIGVMAKRFGFELLFDKDETGVITVDEIGTVTLSGTKYWFKFADGKFKYSTSAGGAVTVLSPSPAISTSLPIWWAVLDSKLFFVDGTNVLRYFNGSAVSTSAIYVRPTVAPAPATGGTGYDYTYTVDNTLGESPACAAPLIDRGSAGTVTITGNTGPQTLVIGDKIRVYSRATSVVAGSKNVTPTSGSHANGTYGSDASGGYLLLSSTAASYDIATVAISDTQPQLYSELGVALNKSAPTALQGITVHYGRLVGWSGSRVYNSKSTNPHSWPDDSAQREAFVYGFGLGDTEDISVCISFRESLYVMKPSNIAVFGGIGPDDTGNNAYSFRRLETNGLGCVAGKSARVIGEDSRTYLIYLSHQGFCATNGADPTRIGENIETEIIGVSNLTNATAYHDKKRGHYVCFLGGQSARIGWVLDTREDNKVMVGWFKWSGINAKCVFWDNDRVLFGTYQGYAGAERNNDLSTDFADVGIEYVGTSDVNTGTEEITVASSYTTGDAVTLRSNGTIPAGLTNNTVYYAIRVSATKIKLATSAVNALAGTAINITSTGSGTHSISKKKSISAFYVTNWMKFGYAALVKKLLKPCLIMNATASSVAITVKTAYDWISIYGDARTIVISSSNTWGADLWGRFVWGSGTVATPKNVSIARRKCRSISYRFENDVINQDFNLQGIEQEFDLIRNRGNYAA